MLRLAHAVSGTHPVCSTQPAVALTPRSRSCAFTSTNINCACLTPRRGVALAAVPEASGSGTTGAEQLQPRPQAKRARLSPAPGEAAPKPRRWHKGSSSQGPLAPGTSPGIASQAPADTQSRLASSTSSQASGPATARRGERAGAGAQPGRSGGAQRDARGGGSSGGGRHEGGRAAGQQRQRRGAFAAVHGADEDDEDDDEDEDLDMEFAGLTEEELEKLVFSSAGGAAASAPAAGVMPGSGAASTSAGSGSAAGSGGKPAGAAGAVDVDSDPGAATAPTGGGGKGGRQGGKKAGSGIGAAEAVAAAQLDEALAARVLAAVVADRATTDGAKLAAQLKQLLAAAKAAAAQGVGAAAPANAAAAAVGGAAAPASAGASPAVAGAGGVVLAAAAAVSSLLDCDADTAMGIVLEWPGYVALPYGDAEERLRALCGFLDVEAAGAREAARCNPALLLVPSDPLRRKLTALANATGLKPTQAAGMVTLYMFPGSK
ncbi:hypothetical protein HYH02_012039 [Chlamydomonas schloesseri]|uniref:Uncharacterized protein n=1 Tax=Chlamydomonas schloesseri TaxID=2026947 RepID=A0A835VZI2_9CHLO|nr:hypothetical protein HYH02_012039 [Chlamydomonas schloesseri]|eukprot:KAG2435042.1 hypothetical protein HYH02_012039 [Chlamydomonas schloesseri]